MLPAQLPTIELYRGDSSAMQLQFFDSNNVPLDLTGVVAKSQIRDRPGGSGTVIDLVCIITLPNTVVVKLLSDDSKKLPQAGFWDLQLTYPSGDVRTPVAAQVSVTMDVTDSASP
jgi:hypothetical protein